MFWIEKISKNETFLYSYIIIPYTGWDPNSYGDLQGAFAEGTWNAESALKPEDDDIILTNRSACNAFEGTGLAVILEEYGIGSLFVGGFLANICVEESIYSASNIEGVSKSSYLCILFCM